MNNLRSNRKPTSNSTLRNITKNPMSKRSSIKNALRKTFRNSTTVEAKNASPRSDSVPLKTKSIISKNGSPTVASTKKTKSKDSALVSEDTKVSLPKTSLSATSTSKLSCKLSRTQLKNQFRSPLKNKSSTNITHRTISSSIKSSTNVASIITQQPGMTGYFTLGSSVSPPAKAFINTFLPLAYPTAISRCKRENAWDLIDTKGNGNVNFPEVHRWIHLALQGAHNSTEIGRGTVLWSLFKPCYIHAYKESKNVIKTMNRLSDQDFFSQENTTSNLITKTGFRVLIANICFAALAFDACATVQMGKPLDMDSISSDGKISQEEWMKRCKLIKNHGLAVSNKMSQGNHLNYSPEKIFEDLEKNEDGLVLFAEWYHYVNGVEMIANDHCKTWWFKITHGTDPQKAIEVHGDAASVSTMSNATTKKEPCPCCNKKSEHISSLESQLEELRRQLNKMSKENAELTSANESLTHQNRQDKFELESRATDIQAGNNILKKNVVTVKKTLVTGQHDKNGTNSEIYNAIMNNLDNTITETLSTEEHKESKTKSKACNAIYDRAISVKYLKEFCLMNPIVLELYTWEVVEKVIKKHTQLADGKKIRFCDLEDVDKGTAEIFISHTWSAKFGDLVSAVVDVCPDETYVWIDIFAVLQHAKDANGDSLFDESDLRFDLVVEIVRAMLLVCNVCEEVGKIPIESILSREAGIGLVEKLPPLRVWCCFEIFNAVKQKKPIVIQAGVAKKCTTVEEGVVKPFELAGRNAMLNLLQLVDLEKSQAKFDYDRVRILNQIREESSIAECNAIVKGAIVGAMAIIFFSDKHEGDFTPVPRAVITHDNSLIRNANYSHIQKDVAFCIAAAGDYVTPMPMLLELGANQNASLEGGVTALHWAASGCQLNACDYLRRVNADFEAQDNMGWNAITWASINKDGTIKTVRRLKELGVNVSAPTNLKEDLLGLPRNSRLTQMSQIMWLIPSGHISAINFFIEHGVDINAVNAKGLTALMFAVAAGKIALLYGLKKLGADLNIVMKTHKQTAAHWAARNGKSEIAQKLIDLGASTDQTDAEGKTVLDILWTNKCHTTPDIKCLGPKEGSFGGVEHTSVRTATLMWKLESLLIQDHSRNPAA